MRRLLKFQEKLVRTSGLPTSRLMDASTTSSLPKSLAAEFEQLAGEERLQVSPQPKVPYPQGFCQPTTPVSRSGTTSTTYSLPLLCSTSQAPVGGYGQGLGQSPGWGVSGVSSPAVWPDARLLGGGVGMCTPTGWPDAGQVGGGGGMSTPTVWPDAGSLGGGLCGSPGSSSGYNQYQSLSPMYQPSSPSGNPAFCFHCLQYGSVYTITQV